MGLPIFVIVSKEIPVPRCQTWRVDDLLSSASTTHLFGNSFKWSAGMFPPQRVRRVGRERSVRGGDGSVQDCVGERFGPAPERRE